MKLLKSEIKYLVQLILTWTFLNLALNMIGLFITKLLNDAEFSYMDSISNEFVKPLVIQSLLFSICLSVAFVLLRNMKYAKYSSYIFVVFQFVVFHIIFFLNLEIHHGLHFQSTFSNVGLSYLSYSGQYLIDILYLYFPINGNFDNGLFRPDNLGTFYIHWILLSLVYYIGLTWISMKAEKYIFDNEPELQKINNKEESQDSQNILE